MVSYPSDRKVTDFLPYYRNMDNIMSKRSITKNHRSQEWLVHQQLTMLNEGKLTFFFSSSQSWGKAKMPTLTAVILHSLKALSSKLWTKGETNIQI